MSQTTRRSVSDVLVALSTKSTEERRQFDRDEFSSNASISGALRRQPPEAIQLPVASAFVLHCVTADSKPTGPH